MARRDLQISTAPREHKVELDDLAEEVAAGNITTSTTRPSTRNRRIRVLDLCSGPGGVGFALRTLFEQPNVNGWFIGVDVEDYADTYPGQFTQMDFQDPTMEGLSLKEHVHLV